MSLAQHFPLSSDTHDISTPSSVNTAVVLSSERTLILPTWGVLMAAMLVGGGAVRINQLN